MRPDSMILQCDVYWHVPNEGEKSDKIKVGSLVRSDGNIYFAYDEAWLPLGIEISPGFLSLDHGALPISLTDPRSQAYIESLELRNEFRGLPGPFYDSLPDRWGMKLIERHTGKLAVSMDPLEILCHRGNRCMGTFSYEPVSSIKSPETFNCDELDLYCRHAAMISSGKDPESLEESIIGALEDSGGSAGGMRPKMLIAIQKGSWSDDEFAAAPTLKKLPGYDHHDMPVDFQPWLLKFDTEPDQYRGLIEQACANMARSAGIIMPETRIIRTQSPSGIEHSHFAVLRFDR